VSGKQRVKRGKSASARTIVPVEPTCDKVRAVAFKIEDKVYEGSSGASHVNLYTFLLRHKRVPAHTLDAWTSDERNHGFVTEKGKFLDRPEVFRLFGADQSQALRAKGLFKSAQ
jgi:hypothetical protein